MTNQRGQFVAFLAGLCVAWSMACSPMAPRSGQADIPDAEVARLQDLLGMDLKPEQVRSPVIDYQFENTVPCAEMLRICYAGLHPVWKVMGGVPLGCTKTFLGTDRDELNYITGTWKTSISYVCELTPDFVRAHEAEHRKGMVHP